MKNSSYKNAVDIFAGEWSSKLPRNFVSGSIDLFSDSRIINICQTISGLQGKTVLESGPLEGAHTSLMIQLGAKKIIGIEANSRAYLKCLITKEILNLHDSKFLLGDFDEYLIECENLL